MRQYSSRQDGISYNRTILELNQITDRQITPSQNLQITPYWNTLAF